MGSNIEACAECKRKCLLCHVDGRNSTPLVSSFFKVMIADRFSEVMYLPPNFAPKVSTLIDQEIPLEDCRGLLWKTKLTVLKNSFAFHEGWDAFALDHGLEIGDFLIFHYILGSHFVVQIFDKTGCEKLDFPENKNMKKTAKADRKSTKKSRSCHSSDKGSMGKQGSNSSAFLKSNVEASQGQFQINENVGIAKSRASDNKNRVAMSQENSEAGFFEDPCSIINRESGGKGAEYRTPVYDFSLEKLANYLDTDEINKNPIGAKKSSHKVHTSLNAENEAGSDCIGSVSKVPFLASMSSLQLEKNLESPSNWSNGADRRCQTDEDTVMAQSGTMAKVTGIEQDDPIFVLPMGSNNKVDGKKLKATNNTSSLPNADTISYLIAANKQAFLELPAALPSSSNNRTIKERRVVFLKDPEMKQWPVLYHQTPKVKLLLSGWEAFCKANNIQPGDKCTFGIESETEGIFRVSIARNS